MIRKLLHAALCIILAPLLVAQELTQAGAQLASANPAEDPAAVPLTIPKNTQIELMTLETVSSATATAGSRVHFVVARDVIVDGVTMIYAGAPVTGIVTSAKRGVAYHQWAGMKIRVKEIQIGSSRKLQLTAFDPRLRATKAALANEIGTCIVTLPFCAVFMIMVSRGCGEDSCSSKPNAESGQQAILPACATSDFWIRSAANVSGAGLEEEKASASANSPSLAALCPQTVELSRIFRDPGVSYVEIK
jgi:hypothetical protein